MTKIRLQNMITSITNYQKPIPIKLTKPLRQGSSLKIPNNHTNDTNFCGAKSFVLGSFLAGSLLLATSCKKTNNNPIKEIISQNVEINDKKWVKILIDNDFKNKEAAVSFASDTLGGIPGEQWCLNKKGDKYYIQLESFTEESSKKIKDLDKYCQNIENNLNLVLKNKLVERNKNYKLDKLTKYEEASLNSKVEFIKNALINNNKAPNSPSTAVREIYKQSQKHSNLKGKETLLVSLAAIESTLDNNAVATSTDARGIFQFIPISWDFYAKKYSEKFNINPATLKRTNMKDNIALGVYRFSRDLELFNGDINKTIRAHLLGPKGAQDSTKGTGYFTKIWTVNKGLEKESNQIAKSILKFKK